MMMTIMEKNYKAQKNPDELSIILDEVQRQRLSALIKEAQEANPNADPDEVVMKDILEAQQSIRK